MKKIITTLLLLVSLQLTAQTSKWSEDVANIIYNNCSTCHRSGNIAPFVLESYADAVTWASMIKTVVDNGSMPPWQADPAFSRHAHERLLTPIEIQKIGDWVTNGTPLGDVSVAPSFPNFTEGSSLSAIDFTARMPDYSSVATTADEYRCFVVPTGITTDRFIQELEIVPGNRGVVHHVLVFGDNSGEASVLDAASPGPGYPCYGDAGTSNTTLLGLWAPGSEPQKLPDGFGIKLAANSDVILQLHYPSGALGSLDSSRVNFKFATASAREVRLDPILNHSTNISSTLIIPANTTPTFTENFTLPGINMTLFAVAPHMHLIGKNIKTYAIPPTGDTIRLNNIKNWDFHWQGMYFYPKALKIPANSTLRAIAEYDNTADNPFNPTSPPALVTLGEATTDEMMLVFFLWTLYTPGDEAIVIDNNLPNLGVTSIADNTPILPLEVYPNPASNQLFINLPNTISHYKISVTDAAGRCIINRVETNIGAGYTSIENVSPGVYTIQLSNHQKVWQSKFVVN